jgi:biopolymer transport protein ExbB
MKVTTTLAVLLLAGAAHAQGPAQNSFEQASADLRSRVDATVEELDELRARIADEKIPLGHRLSELEAELIEARAENQRVQRVLDTRTLDLSNLTRQIEQRRSQASYLSDLLGEYARNFDSRLHVSELQRYRELLDEVRLAPENRNLSDEEISAVRTRLVDVALDRLFDALGGARFEGTAIDETGLVNNGTFVMVGPAVLFRPDGKDVVGTAEQRLGSLEPQQFDFTRPEDVSAAATLASTGQGFFPLDPTLGDAHKVAEQEETLIEHVMKGGPVMVPILAMAGLAFLVAFFKWVAFLFVRKPSRKKLAALLDAVADRDADAVMKRADRIRGPAGRMLIVGVQHIDEPRELIEELMYESVLDTRRKLQRMLPFIATCAASAPLLGLLGTVTGIISTFKQITIFGAGDVKMLSGGISQALITTEFGLIVAIPSLILHAFLSRKAKGVVDAMERSAIAFVNQVSKATPERHTGYLANDEPNGAVWSQRATDEVDRVRGVRSAPALEPTDAGTIRSLEAQLDALRRDYERMARVVDAGGAGPAAAAGAADRPVRARAPHGAPSVAVD